jgi:galactose-1-phosphate uridylyltransferase
MPIDFREEIRSSSLLDPFTRFQEKERTVQLREDPLTGAVSRVFTYRRRPPQTSQGAAGPDDPVPSCAFCPENIETMTPMFPRGLCPEGRIKKGEAVVFPNLFPYDTHNAVVAITHQHEVGIGEWSAGRLADAFEASREYIDRVVQAEGGRWFYSINWNYTPIAGASQVHPHLQVIMSRKPTTEQGRLLEGSRDYFESNSSNYWEDLVEAEKRADLRYVGRRGDISWLLNFAPKGFIPDVTAVMHGNSDFTRCCSGEPGELAEGLVKLLKFYGERRISGANMSLYSQSPGVEHFRTHARLVPRLRIPPLNISDVNYFKLMHDEAISLLTPEELCGELKPCFDD